MKPRLALSRAAAVAGGLLGALALAAAVAVWWIDRWWTSPLNLASPAVLTLEAGDTAVDLAIKIHAVGWVEHARLLPWIMRFTGDAQRLQAGEYRVATGETLEGLMARLLAGDVVVHSFRIVEGSRIADVLNALGEDARLAHTLGAARSETLLADLDLAIALEFGAHGEGWFFPDTYAFNAGDDDRSLLLRAHAKMRMELESAWADRSPDLPYANPYGALIAASLVEKETSRAEDRAHVSQVFAARLERNMRLQADPTVIYGLGEKFDGNLTRSHLRQPTPYNTYVHKGLPPTPIALPGSAALAAALHPSGADYLYFVARGDGSSEFSATLDAHNRAVRKFQLNRRRSRAAPDS
ncbi:MAG: endolytic transglycosylase MltG [Gammaproteobacteria bacterium]|nr:endolytic transglycosylase MltG [Gammaproteobacteria bacterium]